MAHDDSFDACLASLLQTGQAKTTDLLTANRCLLYGVRKGFVVTVDALTRELPRTYLIRWEKSETTTGENTVVELRPRHVPFRGSHASIQDSPAAASTAAADSYQSPGDPMPPRRRVQQVPVAMARPGWFPRVLAGFSTGTLAAALCTVVLGTHGWTNLFLGLTLPLIGSSLGVLSCRVRQTSGTTGSGSDT